MPVLGESGSLERAKDRVCDDENLASAVASEAIKAMGGEGTNRRLGRSLVTAAADAIVGSAGQSDEDAAKAFAASAGKYGNFPTEALGGWLRTVRKSLIGAAAAIEAAAEEDGAGSSADGGAAGAPPAGSFDAPGFAQQERMGPAESRKVQGGLQRPQHIFTAPKPRPRASLLGLDKLAAAKRLEREGQVVATSRLSFEGTSSGAYALLPEEDVDAATDAMPSRPEVGSGSSGAIFGGGGKKRKYRTHEPDTPSHPGGVDRAARERILEKEKRRGGVEAGNDGRIGGSRGSRRNDGIRSGGGDSGRSSDGRDGPDDRDRDRNRRRGDERDDHRRGDDDRRDRDRRHDYGDDGDRGSRSFRWDNRGGTSGAGGSGGERSRRRSRSRSRSGERDGRDHAGGGPPRRRRGRWDTPLSSSADARSSRFGPAKDAGGFGGSFGGGGATHRSGGTGCGDSVVTGRRSPPRRSGIGTDLSEWEEPERLGVTPLPSPSPSVTAAMTPMTAVSRLGGNSGGGGDQEDAWETTSTAPSSSRGFAGGGGRGTGAQMDRRWAAISGRGAGGAGSSFGGEGGEMNEREMRRTREIADPDFDRDFYLSEEGGAMADESRADSLFLGDEEKFRKREAEMSRKRQMGDTKLAGRSARATQLNADQEAWERNRLLTSGAADAGEVRLEFDAEEDTRVQLIVHNIRPPFLDGRVSFTKQQTTQREIRDRSKMRQRFWELGGSRMGNAMGLADDAAAAAKADDDAAEAAHAGGDGADGGGEGGGKKYNYREAAGFAKHMKAQKSGAASDFSRNKTMQEQREYLPVYQVREELLQVIADNQVVVIVGETGSGKTTQLTQYLREAGYTRDGGMIGCTQPRRVAAMSVAKRVSEEMSVELGQEARLFSQVLKNRSDLKLIVTSATLDSERFSSFFGGAPVFRIPGRTFKVETYFAKTPVDDYVDAAVKQALEIHMSHPEGDILIFMTGQEDIEATCSLLAERIGAIVAKANVPPLLLLPMYSQLPADLQAKIFESASEGVRKCIVS
ncbi:unnamed protein product, partial [Phaeothamnion confervicola]